MPFIRESNYVFRPQFMQFLKWSLKWYFWYWRMMNKMTLFFSSSVTINNENVRCFVWCEYEGRSEIWTLTEMEDVFVQRSLRLSGRYRQEVAIEYLTITIIYMSIFFPYILGHRGVEDIKRPSDYVSFANCPNHETILEVSTRGDSSREMLQPSIQPPGKDIFIQKAGK